MPKQADDVITNAVLSVIHKGKWGSGKSIASCSKALRPTYVMDCEDRMNSVINYYRNLDGHVKGLSFDTFAMGDGFYAVKKRLDELEESCPYKTVVCATLTSYVDIVLEGLANKGGSRASGAEAGKKIGGIKVNELEDFNGETAAIAFNLIKTLKRLQKKGINIILEAHVMHYEFKDKVGTVHHERTLLTGGKKAAAKIPGYFNEIFQFEVDTEFNGDTKYIAHTVATMDDFAKTSFPSLPKKIDWTGKDFYEEVFKYIPKEILDAPRVDPNAPKTW